MDSLISFDKIGDVANNLINKLASALGWIANRETPMKIAVNNYIGEISKGDYDPLTKAAMISQAQKTIKEYTRQVNITKIAISNLSDSAKPDDVDDDWLSQFMDKARLVSNKDFQVIWGNILAEECNHPGMVPKSLLHILEQMDKEDAKSFLKVCSVSVWYIVEDGNKEYCPIIHKNELDSFYNSIGITTGHLLNLQALGLIETSLGPLDTGFGIKNKKTPVTIHYFEKCYTLPHTLANFSVGDVVFTKPGAALCSAVNAEKQEEFFEKLCIPMWERESQQHLQARQKPNETSSDSPAPIAD